MCVCVVTCTWGGCFGLGRFGFSHRTIVACIIPPYIYRCVIVLFKKYAFTLLKALITSEHTATSCNWSNHHRHHHQHSESSNHHNHCHYSTCATVAIPILVFVGLLGSAPWTGIIHFGTLVVRLAFINERENTFHAFGGAATSFCVKYTAKRFCKGKQFHNRVII